MIHTAIDYLKSIGGPLVEAKRSKEFRWKPFAEDKSFSPSQFEIWDRTTIEMALIYFLIRKQILWHMFGVLGFLWPHWMFDEIFFDKLAEWDKT